MTTWPHRLNLQMTCSVPVRFSIVQNDCQSLLSIPPDTCWKLHVSVNNSGLAQAQFEYNTSWCEVIVVPHNKGAKHYRGW